MSEDNPPGRGDPTKVQIMGILQYEDGRVTNARDFALDLRKSNTLRPVIGSKSVNYGTDVSKNIRRLGRAPFAMGNFYLPYGAATFRSGVILGRTRFKLGYSNRAT